MSTETYSVSFDTSGLKSDISVAQESVDKYIKTCLRDSCIMVSKSAKKDHKFKNRTGNLERAIKYMVVNKLETGIVYVDLNQVPYGTYVNENTGLFGSRGAKYPIFPVRAKALSFFWERYGQWAVFKSVQHPGHKADKFLNNALDANKDNIDNIFAEGLRRLING